VIICARDDDPATRHFYSSGSAGYGELDDLVIVEVLIKVLAVSEEVEELVCGLVSLLDVIFKGRIERVPEEIVLASASFFDLDEVCRRKDWTEQPRLSRSGQS
jgi:hypothetical protein